MKDQSVLHSGLTLLLILLLIGSCGKKNNVYEHQKSIPEFQWEYDYKPSFKVSIPDTQSAYNMYAIIRHNENYPFKNLWVILHTQTPSGVKRQNRLELTLAHKSGKWHGSGLGGIWEVRIPIKEKFKFDEQGDYTFKLEQHMRKNPLPAIMNIGLRIERIPNSLNLKK